MADVVIRGIDPKTQISSSVYANHEVIVLPEGHGPLIDRNNIGLTDFEILMCDGDFKKALQLYIAKIAYLPVLLEAEESVDKLRKEMEK